MTLRTELLPSMSNDSTHAAPPVRKRSVALLAMIATGVIGVGVLGYALKGSGIVSKALVWAHIRAPRPTRGEVINVPLVITKELSPRDCSTGVDPAAPIVLTLTLPNGPIDLSTLNDESVSVFRFDNRQRVPAKVVFAGNAIRITPAAPLEADRNYRVHLLPGVKDIKGLPLKQMSMAFFTRSKAAANIAFERVALPEAQGAGGYSPGAGDPNGFDANTKAAAKPAADPADHDSADGQPSFSEGFTCLEFGPDGKLYSSTDHGKIVRFTVKPDGQLSNRETFATLPDHEGGDRLVTGFCFDPKSTAENLIVYVTSSEFGFGFPKAVTDFSGQVSRLTGPKLEKYELLVSNLPRSGRDHATNQPHFGPDGALYIPQPSNTATGGADQTWWMREEHLLNATILRLDVTKLAPGKPIDSKTIDVGGTYDPAAPDAPLTIYAKGLRMPYDLLWHSNGKLYTAVNGASGGGATPAGPNVKRLSKVTITEHDWLFRIDGPGHYFGHPNPAQGLYVLNGGNPTSAPDFNEVSDYPVGTQPDSGWTPAAYDFGGHVSADGTIEYRSDTFGGALKGKMIICRYSYYQDLIVLGLDDAGNVNSAVTGIPGMTDLEQPLDLVEDVRNGNLYVCEYGAATGRPPRITLLRPIRR